MGVPIRKIDTIFWRLRRPASEIHWWTISFWILINSARIWTFRATHPLISLSTILTTTPNRLSTIQKTATTLRILTTPAIAFIVAKVTPGIGQIAAARRITATTTSLNLPTSCMLAARATSTSNPTEELWFIPQTEGSLLLHRSRVVAHLQGVNIRRTP